MADIQIHSSVVFVSRHGFIDGAKHKGIDRLSHLLCVGLDDSALPFFSAHTDVIITFLVVHLYGALLRF